MDINNIPEPFTTHKVILKSIYDGYRYPSPSKALEYIFAKFKDIDIVINKQKTKSITITIRCSDTMYQSVKLHFVKDMGEKFLWRDLKEKKRNVFKK
jgi:hypothetical protein